MPDILNENGLQTKSLNEIISDLEDGFKEIYGTDINLDSNTPDGQIINIFAQAGVDIRELITDIYNSFDPDKAAGTPLESRCAINNIERQGGTFTIVPIDIEVDRTVELEGLDDEFNNPDATGYTVQDDEGNKFILIDSQTLTSGTHTVNFRAENTGAVEVLVGTITNQVTVVLGVVSVNNSSGALETGQDEETDFELRTRREQSIALASSGYLNGLEGDILNLDGVTDAKVYENVTDSVDSDGIPAHGIWAIVEGGSNADIANAIYVNKSYGSNLKGSVSIDITTASGATFTAKFDRPAAKDLYIRFDLQPTKSGVTYDISGIKEYIVNNLSYNIGDFAETSQITCIAKEAINETTQGAVPVNVEISEDNSNWFDYLEVDTLDEQWTIDTSRITITEL